ncbi:DegQ family serine endoprotease [Tistrella mobilis]|uniref:Probable periplasmic serine endoprotease DegP-like n=1 Tax=Tistrella mobilis (strain KA081020-065) TaxID=1110502 RepID=I3TP01_TISMK|nr:DegQ family serine endoprotease [Tistrella mobilis]AFK54489.1 putative serine protease do-like protein [Tistrella mobilis KA081020-065]
MTEQLPQPAAIRTRDFAARRHANRLRRYGAGLMAGVALALPLAAVGGTVIAPVPANAASLPESFAPLAEKVMPAVVNISTTQEVQQPSGPEQMLPFDLPENSPFRRFFEPFMQGQQPTHPQVVNALGSGFIIDPSGYVVTNNHVIDGATEIKVTLEDKSQYTAKLVGRDPLTDLALLKIEAGHDLPAVQFGDSDAARVGDWVLAVGNPFGLGGTVTAGIVSARNRDINAGPYDDFLQIDAAINRGNSGGPVFDESGKVIGINTAIYSPNGGSVGIGFSIPANIATKVVAQLKESGSISRGWLGVEIQPLTPEIAEALGMDKPEGALVARVLPGSPAGDAGLERGDVVVQIDGQPVKDARDLTRKVGDLQPGDRVGLAVKRQGDEKEIRIRLGERPQDLAANQQGDHADPGAGVAVDALGVRLAPIDDGLRQRLGIDDSVKGVAVVDILPPKGDDKRPHAGPGPELRPGDVIEQVAGTAVDRPSQVTALIDEARARKRDHVLLLVARGNESRFVAVEIK